MSAQDFALKRAAELVQDDPGAAYDLVLAADELDKVAAKSPEVVTLNRAMKKLKTEVVKYLAQEVPDLVWSAGGNFDYIGMGTTVIFWGRTDTEGPPSVTIEANITPEREEPGVYWAYVVVKGKGRRQIHAQKDKYQLEDLKSRPAKWLAKVAAAVERNLKGSLDAEKQELLDAIGEAEDAYKTELDAMKQLRAAVTKSTNLVGDAMDIRRLIPDARMDYPLDRIRRLLDEIHKAGG